MTDKKTVEKLCLGLLLNAGTGRQISSIGQQVKRVHRIISAGLQVRILSLGP